MIHKRIPYRIQQRERHIAQCLFIIKYIWRDDIETFSFPWNQPEFFDKRNLSCNCWMCSKSSKTWYAGHKTSEKRKLLKERDNDYEN